MMTTLNVSGSFRDPSGNLFIDGGVLYRSVRNRYRDRYDKLMQSGLYARLVEKGLLIPHEEAGKAGDPDVYQIIRPERVEFISYPYEWSPSQLRDAALATLRIQQEALAFGMTLKDASAYNIQFHRGRPVLIDTLSFDIQAEGAPWIAYRQFCQHFLGPLALMRMRDGRLGQMLRLFIDGMPLDITSRLLPKRTWLSPSLLSHIHLHARFQQKYSDTHAAVPDAKAAKMSRTGMLGMLANLESCVRGLEYVPRVSEWSDYYADTNYTQRGLEHKRELVGQYLDHGAPRMVWDIGANNGFFSKVAAEKGMSVISIDADQEAVEANYRDCRKSGEKRILPLWIDLTNPSGGIGWHCRERESLIERGPADIGLALALVHHLSISNNVPLPMLADFFADCARRLIIEWVPKEDSQVQRLLRSREDIFTDYNQASFETAFKTRFTILESAPVADSRRTLYLMQRNE
ncbi:SAM-dependent methyltransferase [bacterium]|nr:SAM-dependent methyltransferase [bacterium]